MIEICASVLAANHAHIARDIAVAECAGVKRFHFDVCDGHYTRNIIFGNQLVEDVRVESTSYFDVHLAVYNMESILESFLGCGAEMINVQYEACEDPVKLVDIIHAHELEAGICFIPSTGAGVIERFIGMADTVNLLAVNPGIGGQQFDYSVLGKIEQIADYIERHGAHTKISVDGGVNAGTIRDVVNAGADIAILGSGIFSGDIRENISQLQTIIAEL